MSTTMGKVIFADRAAITECYNRVMRRQKSAKDYQMTQRAKLLGNMKEVSGNKSYFKMGDVANALGLPRKSEAVLTITAQPKTMAGLRERGWPKDSALSYLEQV